MNNKLKNIARHKPALLVIDIFLFVTVLYNHYIIYITISKSRISEFADEIFISSIYFIIIVLSLFYINQLYKYQSILDRAKQSFLIARSLFTSFVITIFFDFIFKLENLVEYRLFLITQVFTIFLAFLIFRVYMAPKIYYWLIRTKKINRNILVVGAGDYGKKIVNLLYSQKKNYFTVVGYLDDDKKKQNQSIEGIQVLGKIKDIEKIVKNHIISDIFIIINNITHEKLLSLIDFCKKSKKRIHVASNLYDIVQRKLEIEEIAGTNFFRIKPTDKIIVYENIKRIFDFILSIAFIIVTLPIWIILSIIIKSTSKGPVIYKATVIGKNCRHFTWYKFRSMTVDNNDYIHRKLIKSIIKDGSSGEKLKNDNRITSIGHFLRKYSIDEIPQLINVVRGEMSLVGPHPKLQYEFELMEDWQKRRFTVKPGITGIWQIRGRNEVKFNDEIVLDLYYIENRSLALDFEILLKTIPAVISGRTGK